MLRVHNHYDLHGRCILRESLIQGDVDEKLTAVNAKISAVSNKSLILCMLLWEYFAFVQIIFIIGIVLDTTVKLILEWSHGKLVKVFRFVCSLTPAFFPAQITHAHNHPYTLRKHSMKREVYGIVHDFSFVLFISVHVPGYDCNLQKGSFYHM